MCMGNGSKGAARAAAFRRLCVRADSGHQRAQGGPAGSNAQRQSEAHARSPRHPRKGRDPRRVELRTRRTHAESLRRGRFAFRVQRRRSRAMAIRSNANRRGSRRSAEEHHFGLDGEKIYRIAYDPERGKLDADETKQQRDTERRKRLARGKSYDEFHKEWNETKPPKDILQFYGRWPDAKSLGPIFRQ